MNEKAISHFRATGKVQGIMFRQTLIRGAEKLSLKAGASNCSKDRNKAYFCLMGDIEKINGLADRLSSGERLNSWGARVEKLEELSVQKSIKDYEVNSENVNNFNWNPNITLYL